MRSQFASLRVLTLPAGATTGTRIVINGITGTIEFYNELNELVGFLSPDQWFTGDQDGSKVQLDPFGGLRIYNQDGLIASLIDSSAGLQIRDPTSGNVIATLSTSGLHVDDPTGDGDIDITNGAMGSIPSPRYAGTTAAIPGTTMDTPAVVASTASDLELRHVACWANNQRGAESFTTPVGYTEEFDVNSDGNNCTLGVVLASRAPAVSNAVRTFTNTDAAFQFDTGHTIVIRGVTGTVPSVVGFTQSFTVVPPLASESIALSQAPPVGIAAGQVLLAFVTMGNRGGSVPNSWSVPEGWIFLGAKFSTAGTGATQSTLATGVWYKIATASEPATYDITVNLPGRDVKKFHGTIVAIQNAAEAGVGPDIRIGGLSIERGVLALGRRAANKALAAGVEAGFMRLDTPVTLLDGRSYKLFGQASFSNVSTRVISRIRFTTDGSVPTLASGILEESIFQTTAVGATGGTARIMARVTPSPADLNFRCIYTLEAGAAITAFGGLNNEHGDFEIEDIGRALDTPTLIDV